MSNVTAASKAGTQQIRPSFVGHSDKNAALTVNHVNANERHARLFLETLVSVTEGKRARVRRIS